MECFWTFLPGFAVTDSLSCVVCDVAFTLLLENFGVADTGGSGTLWNDCAITRWYDYVGHGGDVKERLKELNTRMSGTSSEASFQANMGGGRGPMMCSDGAVRVREGVTQIGVC